MNPLKTNPVIVSPAAENDLAEIVRLARILDLDCEDLSWNQFLLARTGHAIIGFGRLRSYGTCTEIATVGVVPEERKKGVGSAVVSALIAKGPREIYVTCVIPDFFSRFGFKPVKEYPPVLEKKVDFCKQYDFREDQIFVMKMTK